jgi:uncharacterized membrane protein
MFTSRASVQESSNKILRELSEQIKQIREDLLLGQGKGAESCTAQSQHAQDHGAHHGHGHDPHMQHASLVLSVTMIRFISESLSAVGVAVMVLAAVGTIPLIITDILPFFFRPKKQNRPDAQCSILFCRMQLARGIMLGMDFMVAADVVETLLHQIDLVKLLCIIAIRSWLGFERSKEAQHISHEISDWKKAHPLLAKNLGDVLDDRCLSDRIRETFDQYDTDHNGSVSKIELRQAFVRVGLDVNEKEISEILGENETLTFDQFDQYVRKLVHEASKNSEASKH